MKTLIPTFLFFLVLCLSAILVRLTYRAVVGHPPVASSQAEPAADLTAAEESADEEESEPSESEPEPSEPPKARANPFVHRAAHDHWTNFEDATDHVAAEILDAASDRPTLAIWLFDRTESATSQRDRVGRRFSWAYRTLDELLPRPPADDPAATPLLSVVGAFGDQVEFLTPEPTADSSRLIAAVAAIREDNQSQENTFAAIDAAVKKFAQPKTWGHRQVLVVVVSDEAGDDDILLDDLVVRLRKAAIAVHVLGIAAPLGSKASLAPIVRIENLKPVRQGPESLEPEVLDLGGWGGNWGGPVDSGFGPFALSRLALETGGRYLAVRPAAVFDPQRMARYAPDYVSRPAYQQLLEANKARAALVEAGKQPHLDLVGQLEMQFARKDEASLKRSLDKAQQASARLEPKLLPLYRLVAAGEADRPKLTSPRWQAGYDLALGRVAAARARIEGYNAALAQLKAGRAPGDPKHKTWVLQPTNAIQGDSALEKLAGQARTALERVIHEHAGTPWAMLAAKELSVPLGWEWTSR